MSSQVCPDHGSVSYMEWCRSDGKLHLGARCSVCRLWLGWLPADTPGAPAIPAFVEPFRQRVTA